MTDNRPTWDETRLEMARTLAKRSKCVRSQVGAIITDAGNHLISEGYNGPPGMLPGTDGPCTEWCPRSRDGVGIGTQEFSACEALHGEINSLLKGARGVVNGGTMYVTRLPCITCSRSIAGAGLARVVWADDGSEDPERVAQVTAYLGEVKVDIIAAQSVRPTFRNRSR